MTLILYNSNITYLRGHNIAVDITCELCRYGNKPYECRLLDIYSDPYNGTNPCLISEVKYLKM
jgi:hypothetical protein